MKQTNSGEDKSNSIRHILKEGGQATTFNEIEALGVREINGRSRVLWMPTQPITGANPDNDRPSLCAARGDPKWGEVQS